MASVCLLVCIFVWGVNISAKQSEGGGER